MRAPFSAGFTPLLVSGCLVWLDSRKASHSGSTLTAWADSSGNGKNATLGTAPGYTAANASYNNMPSVDFSSTKTITLPDLGITTGDYSVVFVGHQGNINADAYGTTGTTPPLMRMFNNNPNWSFARDGVNAHGVNRGTSASPNIMIGTMSGTAVKMYASQLTPGTSNAGVASDLTGKTLLLGNYAAGVNALFTLGGPIVQFLVFNKAISATEVTYLMTGFGSLTGLSIGA